MRRVGRHLLIVALLLGMLASNLRSGPVDAVLEPVFGRAYLVLGIRQYWAMFAPDPVHHATFVDAVAWEGGVPRALPVSVEPPVGKPFVAFTYDRILKLHKRVAGKPEVYAPAYVRALCLAHAVQGEVELVRVVHRTPTPARRLAGDPVPREVASLGRWPCP